jgi:hypothetical protein
VSFVTQKRESSSFHHRPAARHFDMAVVDALDGGMETSPGSPAKRLGAVHRRHWAVFDRVNHGCACARRAAPWLVQGKESRGSAGTGAGGDQQAACKPPSPAPPFEFPTWHVRKRCACHERPEDEGGRFRHCASCGPSCQFNWQPEARPWTMGKKALWSGRCMQVPAKPQASQMETPPNPASVEYRVHG